MGRGGNLLLCSRELARKLKVRVAYWKNVTEIVLPS